MSTHASAPLLAAVAYTYARRYSDDPDFTFGTGQSETWPDRASPSSSHGHGQKRAAFATIFLVMTSQGLQALT